jgi:signal transduction histidine kinase
VPEVFETKFTMPAGTKWIRSAYQPMFDDEHAVVGIQVISQDISTQKQAEEALRDYNDRLASEVAARTRELTEAQEKLFRQEKLAVLGQLAGSVGHELRNPLGVINNAAYYLKMIQPEADEKIRKYHGVIEQEVHNAEKIINDLLDFARIKSVDRELVAIPALVQRVLERFPVPYYITTVLDLPPELPNVFVDLRQMEQVLGNLTTNACQAMKEAGQLTVSSEQSSASAERWVLIRVKDTGTGITPENLKKLFEPLFTTKPRGIGLGLAVSKKLVEANGGRIEVESEVGKGSTFTLYLPVKSSELDG